MSVFSNPSSRSADHARAYTAAVLDLLGKRAPADVLRSTPSELPRYLDGLTVQDRQQPEAPGKWSISAVLQHLADSELVWGFRLRLVLAHDRPSITGYDQDLWAERLRYADADAEQAISDFSTLRAANLRLLARSSPEDMSRIGVHAERGEESVAHMIRLYAGHDLLHLQQLARIRAAIGRGSAGTE